MMMMSALKNHGIFHQGKSRHAEAIDIWALGITIVCGGQYFSWNEGLAGGFGSYMVATILMGLAYTFLCLCTAELSSTLPFAGTV
jgi:amino acid transporter